MNDIVLDRIILESIQNTLHETIWESFSLKRIQQGIELLNPEKVFLSSIDTLEQCNYLKDLYDSFPIKNTLHLFLNQSVKFLRMYLFRVALNLCKYSTEYLKEAKSILCIVGV